MATRLLYLAAIFLFSFIANAHPPPIKRFRFMAAEKKVLPGNSTENKRGFCSGEIKAEDQIGDFAVVALFYHNGCYTDGNYNHKNFPVEWGVAATHDGLFRYPAVRIHPPQSRARQFLASNHVGYYRADQDFDIFVLEEGLLSRIGRTAAATDGYRRAEVINLSLAEQARVYVFIPQAEAFSSYHKISEKTEAARIYEDSHFSVDKYRISVTGKIFDTARDFDFGPETHKAVYGQNRTFFSTATANGIAVIWQDRASFEIYLSLLDSDFATPQQKKLPSLAGHLLAAATADDAGNIYYILIEKNEKSSLNRTLRASAFKVSPEGRLLKKTALDASEKGLNMTGFSDSHICSMQYSNGKLGGIISRDLHRASDGLNHQAAAAFVMDAESLAITKNYGIITGHSFGNAMSINHEGKFLAIDLGDNYPRGVHLHRFDEKNHESKVVYTFKTEHASGPRSSAGQFFPLYTEISGGGKKYYRWSNDNRTYSEIGGVHELTNSIVVFFVGEPDSSGRAINNARVGNYLNDARNLGMVIVKKDFTSQDYVLSQGINEQGGFYSFHGRFFKQENRGIVWLTGHKNKSQHNATRVKTAALDRDSIFVLYEIWTKTRYSSTQLNVIKPATGQIVASANIGPILRLGWRDDLLVKDGKVYAISGDRVDGKLDIAVISVR
ncbi:MAG: hypothetical protein RML34_07480 [Leptospiraceae bacterium]|nr:hypothetical protein [Leptospiraceae bacterium]